MLDLYFREIKDQFLRENFRKLSQFLNRDQTMLRGGWKHYELVFTTTYTGLEIPHKLSYAPKDLIQTYLTGSGTITWNYSDFNGTNINVDVGGTVTGANPTTVRFILGRYS